MFSVRPNTAISRINLHPDLETHSVALPGPLLAVLPSVDPALVQNDVFTFMGRTRNQMG